MILVYPGPGNIWFPIAFVLIMMLVAALVAAAGDRMGHRAARRKLRIGKLRPRHVSTLIAVVSGVVISVATVLVMFLVWHDFYNALTQWDNLNGELAKVQAQTKQAQEDKKQAEEETGRAQSALDVALAEIENKSADIKQKTHAILEVRSKLGAAQSQLQDSIAKRDRAQREYLRAKGEAERAKKDKDLSDFIVKQKQEVVKQAQQEFERLDQQVKDLRAEISRTQTGQGVMAVGQELGYVQVKGGQLEQIQQALQDKLLEIKNDIESQGLQFDPQSRDKVIAFLNTFPDDDSEYIVTIKSAENVFVGDRVLLDFDYRKVAPLVAAGSNILDIRLYDNRAVISGLGGVHTEVSIPAQLDRDSIVDLAVAAESTFQRGASAAGFIADEKTGSIPSPLEKLIGVADQLVSQQRPLRIQFVAKSSATALEGSVLAGAELHLTSMPRSDEREQPVPQPEDQPTEEAPETPVQETPAPEGEGNNPG